MKLQTNSNLKKMIDHNKPALQVWVYFFFLFTLMSCGSFVLPGVAKNQTMFNGKFESISSSDYSDHLASLGLAFLATPGVKIITNRIAYSYLKDVSGIIISKNEVFFKNVKEVKISILDNDSPVHFSLPGGSIFLSSGLINKYIKHESMLVSILSYELVRIEKLLYPKQVMIPVGFIPLERLLNLGRLSLDEKVEIHKWAHYLTTRSGYDGEYYLSWLQTQNRNTADFILQAGDASLVDREESLFKSFLIKNTKKNEEVAIKKNSSKNFYGFINSIRDQRL